MNINKLTLGEIAKVEELSGISINEIGGNTAPQGKAMAALVFVLKRREDPSFTFNDAMNLGIDDLNSVLGVDEDELPDPKETD